MKTQNELLHHKNVVQGLVCIALFRTLWDVLFCAVSFIYELVLLRLHLLDICFPCIFFPQKQCYQDQTATSNGPKATHFHMLSTDSNHVSAGFSREGKHSHKDQAGHSNMQHKGKKCKTKNKHNVNKQQDQGKKTDGRTDRQTDRHTHTHLNEQLAFRMFSDLVYVAGVVILLLLSECHTWSQQLQMFSCPSAAHRVFSFHQLWLNNM